MLAPGAVSSAHESAERSRRSVVKAPDIAYLRVASLSAALAALAQHGDDAMVLAGGQSLMAMHNLRVAHAKVLVDINRIPGLDAIRVHDGVLVIGCLARHAALAASALVQRHAPLIAQAMPHVAHHAIRNRGTIGGSLALADPAAELPACCVALDAVLVAAGPDGTRRIGAADFFTGVYDTALRPGELLIEVQVPLAAPDAVQRFAEIARRRGDFAIAGAALAARRDGESLQAVRLALLGMGDRPLLAQRTMALLEGKDPARIAAPALAAALADDADPLDDPAYPAAYRRRVIEVVVRRMLEALAGQPA
jgi:carbon-monoxide dehydrogenase medium subunit